MKRRLFMALASVAIAAVTLWYLITPDTTAALRTAVSTASPVWFLAALALMPVIQTVRAWRFNTLLFGHDSTQPGLRPGLRPGMWAVTTTLLAVNTVLPFKLGEASFPVMVRRLYGVSLVDGAGVILFARLLDLAAISTLLISLMLVNGMVSAVGAPVWLGALALIGAALVSLLPIWLRLFAIPEPPANTGRTQRLLREMMLLRSRLTTVRAAVSVVLTSYMVWALHALAAVLAVSAVDGALSGPAAPILSASAGLVSNIAFALPITGVAGLGAPQAAWVAMMHLGSIPLADAVVGAFAYTAVTLTATVVLGSIGASIFLALATRKSGVTSPEGHDGGGP